MHKRRGFGLIDTVVTITLASVLIIGFLSFLPTALSGQRKMDHRLLANDWAQSELESRKSRPLVAGTRVDLGTRQLDDNISLRGSLKVDAVAGLSNAYRIRVDVSWRERSRPMNAFRETMVCPIAR